MNKLSIPRVSFDFLVKLPEKDRLFTVFKQHQPFQTTSFLNVVFGRRNEFMPKFSANITDGWLFKELDFYDRIKAAHDNGFSAIECANPYPYDPHKIKKCLDKYYMTCSLINNETLANPPNTNNSRKFNGIYNDSKDIFLKSLENTLKYASILNCKTIHIMSGIIISSDNILSYDNTFISNLKLAQDIIKNKHNNKFNIVIEPICNEVINNYYLNSFDKAINIINNVNINCSQRNVNNIKLQFDIFHCQMIHGNLTSYLSNSINNNILGYIQISNVPNRDEPFNNNKLGEINYYYIYHLLDNVLKYNSWVGLEYKPKQNTNIGLQFDNNWFKRFNKIQIINSNNKNKNKNKINNRNKLIDLSIIVCIIGSFFIKQRIKSNKRYN